MDYRDVFKRYEIKYLLTDSQKKRIDEAMAQHAQPDQYGHSTICNIYYDTPDFRLIRRSLEKPLYKEKLRVRSYGVPEKDGRVFIELKKKYKSVTYKRRTDSTQKDAESWLINGGVRPDIQIAKEIDYALKFYGSLAPAVYISYEREAFTGVNERDFRITFDKNILWRRDDLTLSDGIYGKSLLPEGLTLMELKTPDAIPLWFTQVLDECRLYHTHFSKYGAAYEALCAERSMPEKTLVANKRKIIAATGDIIYA